MPSFVPTSKFTIVFAPGAWVYLDIFNEFRATLASEGYLSKGGFGWVLVTHSCGGAVGALAVEGLGVAERAKNNLPGGITTLAYMTAFVLPIGISMLDIMVGTWLPWMEIDGDHVRANSNATKPADDFSPVQKLFWGGRHTHISKAVFQQKGTYQPWDHGIPTAYIFTENDPALPLPVQQGMAAQLGPDVTTFSINSSHFPFHSKSEKVVEAVIAVADSGLVKKATALAALGK